jgi:hypothetical protein
MTYLKAVNGIVEQYPYSISQLKNDNPNVSFPKEPTDELLADWDVYPVTVAQTPVYDSLVQAAKQDAPQNVNGAWMVAWLVQQLPLEQADQNVRYKRDKLLYECDWTQLPDAPVDKAVWAVYRQELRNVPQQEGFPYSVVWPTPPA